MNIPKRSGAVWLSAIGIILTLILMNLLSQVTRNQESGNGEQVPNISAGTLIPPSPSTSITPLTPTPIAWVTETYVWDLPATETRVIATELAFQAALRTTTSYQLTTTPIGTARIPRGILEANLPHPFIPDNFAIQNYWRDEINGQQVSVHAGVLRDDAEQGVVFVLQTGTFYLTPIRAGSVRIVAEENDRLTLLSANGTTFYFDVPGHRFVISLTEVVPTITPVPPSVTPTITLTPTPVTITPWPTCTPGPTPGALTPAWPPTCI